MQEKPAGFAVINRETGEEVATIDTPFGATTLFLFLAYLKAHLSLDDFFASLQGLQSSPVRLWQTFHDIRQKLRVRA